MMQWMQERWGALLLRWAIWRMTPEQRAAFAEEYIDRLLLDEMRRSSPIRSMFPRKPVDAPTFTFTRKEDEYE